VWNGVEPAVGDKSAMSGDGFVRARLSCKITKASVEPARPLVAAIVIHAADTGRVHMGIVPKGSL
jgi:hypothetical protein